MRHGVDGIVDAELHSAARFVNAAFGGALARAAFFEVSLASTTFFAAFFPGTAFFAEMAFFAVFLTALRVTLAAFFAARPAGRALRAAAFFAVFFAAFLPARLATFFTAALVSSSPLGTSWASCSRDAAELAEEPRVWLCCHRG